MNTLKQLVYRDYLNQRRNLMLLPSKILIVVFLSLYIAGLYASFTGEYLALSNWLALTGFFFFNSASTVLGDLAPIGLTFPTDRKVFLKEQSAKLYSTLPYFISKSIVEIPISIIIPLLQSLILYWFVGLSNTASQFFVYYLIALLLAINGASLGLMVGSLAQDIKAVSIAAPMIVIPIFAFSGFFKNTDNIPGWIGWIQYISPMKYGFEAWVQN